MLVLAREANGWTQSHLARLVDITQGHLSKIESGFVPPPESLIERLSGALGYPRRFLSLDDPLYGPGASEFFHRKRQTSPRMLARLHAQLNIRRIHIARLLKAVDLNADNIPRLDLDEFESPEEIARAIRAAWQLPPGPLRNLTGAIEDAGGIVTRCDLGALQVSGVSRWVPGMPPLFFLNQDMPGDHERMTLAHELGHIVMHAVPRPSMEQEAFAFANALLLPEQDLKPYIAGGVTLPLLANLKPYWGVSIAALIMAVSSLELVTERQARSLWMQMSKAGYRRREPPELDVPREAPTLLQEILDVHVNELGYRPEELAALLHVTPSRLRREYGIEELGDTRPALRMVGR